MTNGHLLNARLIHDEGYVDKGRTSILRCFKFDFSAAKTHTCDVVLSHPETESESHGKIMSEVAYPRYGRI